MFHNKALFILLAGLTLVLSSQICAAKDYLIGTVFNDIIEFNYPGAQLKVPLPPGDWIFMNKTEWRTDQNTPIARLYFLRHNKKTRKWHAFGAHN